jgi:hypothetical protein
MGRATLCLATLLLCGALAVSQGQRSSDPSFDYDVARTHEIKPHRRTIPLTGCISASISFD